MIKKIAVLTSGGDSPGMNAAIRAVVRQAAANNIKVIGIIGGYRGLINKDMVVLGSRSVGNIIQRGGTVLRTARSGEFRTKQGVLAAARTLRSKGIQGLVAIGGDGTFRGAVDLLRVWKGKVIGVPGTIDNDIYGTDYTIGFDTAVNTALGAIDKIRDTADAHERFFIVEVMGRHSGFIAQNVGIGGGAEDILIPETLTDLPAIAKNLLEAQKKGKTSSIIVVAEGDEAGDAAEIGRKLKEISGLDNHVVVLGHVQRGGSPGALDRKLATRLGAFAVDCLIRGRSGVMAGEKNGRLVTIPLKTAAAKKKKIDAYIQKLIPALSR